MKEFSRFMSAFILALSLSFGTFHGAAHGVSAKQPSSVPSVGILSPTYSYCFNRWQPDYVKSVQKADYRDASGVINAWSKCLGKKFLASCRSQIYGFLETVRPFDGTNFVFVARWKKFYDSFNACAKKTLTSYPKCTVGLPYAKVKGKLLGEQKTGTSLTYRPATWKDNSGTVKVTWFAGSQEIAPADVKQGSNYQFLFLDRWMAGKTIKVVEVAHEVTAGKCWSSVSTSTASKPIVRSTLKAIPASYAPKVTSRDLWPETCAELDSTDLEQRPEYIFHEWAFSSATDNFWIENEYLGCFPFSADITAWVTVYLKGYVPKTFYLEVPFDPSLPIRTS